MMQRLTLFLIAVLVGGCAPDGPLFEANPVSPSAKITASRDPFSGLNEEGHFKGIGPSEATFRAYFQMITRRLATALKDKDARAGVIRGIQSAPQQEANIAKLLSSQPELLATVADGFKTEVVGASLTNSKLPGIITAYDDGNAFMAICEAMYGLEIHLINGASYQGTTAIPVFHDPIIDEKDTKRWDGFSPDGESETMPFSMDGFTRSDPFFFITYDDEFYYKSENAIAALAPPALGEPPTFFAGLSPLLSWLVEPAWAHHPPPHYPAHSALPDCYEEKSGYLSRFRFTNSHESNGTSPDMEIIVNASFKTMPPESEWQGHQVPRGRAIAL